MENYILIAIVVVVVALAARATIKRFSGGGCHGGGNYKLKKKKLTNVKYQKVFHVEGMHCENCKKRVEEVVGDIKGVAGTVNLKKAQVTVSYEEDVDDEIITSKIERAGYHVTGDVQTLA